MESQRDRFSQRRTSKQEFAAQEVDGPNSAPSLFSLLFGLFVLMFWIIKVWSETIFTKELQKLEKGAMDEYITAMPGWIKDWRFMKKKRE